MKLFTKIINKIFPNKEHKRQFQEILDWNANKKMCPESRVVCAANRIEGIPELLLGARHWDSAMHQVAMTNPKKYYKKKCETGFIDQFNNFLTREEAYEIASKNGQIIRILGTEHTKKLYSENLY